MRPGNECRGLGNTRAWVQPWEAGTKEEVRNFKMLRLKIEKILIPLKSNLT